METDHESRFKGARSGIWKEKANSPIRKASGSTVQLTIYKNLNGNTRATYWGTNNDGYTYRIISELAQTNVGSVSKWKALATVAVTSEDQRPYIKSNFSTAFTNITIDNKAVTPVIDTQDFAKLTVSGSSVSMSVVKKNVERTISDIVRFVRVCRIRKSLIFRITFNKQTLLHSKCRFLYNN